MLILTKLATADTLLSECKQTLSLSIDARIRSRMKVNLDDGTEAGLFLPRGIILRHGDVLESEQGTLVTVLAADEHVSTVYCQDPHLLACVCYHLGNRHVPLQITREWVRYQHDHVLDLLVEGLGAEVIAEQAPFEPEDGAYGGKHSAHNH